MLKIAITGPESTGKTTLARELAAHYRTLWVPEYARFYLSRLRRPYTPEDVLEIAKGQLQWENIWTQQANGLLFCDTELIVAKIWLRYKYDLVHPWIEEQLQQQQYSLHLLCDIDLPWEDDPLREHPDLQDRQILYHLYKNELISLGVPFVEIAGNQQERLQKGIEVVEALRVSIQG